MKREKNQGQRTQSKPNTKAARYGSGGFFLSRNTARSYPPLGQKTPDTDRAFFGLSAPRRKESPSASLLREVARGARRKEFRLPAFSPAFSLSPLTPSVAFGDSSLKREPFGTGDRALGREPNRGSRFPLHNKKPVHSVTGRLLGKESLCSHFLCSLPLQKVFCLLFFRKEGFFRKGRSFPKKFFPRG